MRTESVVPWVAVALTLGALVGAAYPQSGPATAFAGDWKASLEAGGKSLRLVLHATLAESAYSASLDSLDPAAFALPVDAIRIDTAHLHFEMSRLGARFDGDWNPATLQFEGQWQQGPTALPLQWKRAPASGAAPDRPMSQEDREYLGAYLKKTQDDLLRSIAQLTPAQWTYRPDPRPLVDRPVCGAPADRGADAVPGSDPPDRPHPPAGRPGSNRSKAG